jgi:DMSO/TMAO reductase YedYZ molybdopterin-dependent catalytic subunit
MSQFTAGFAGRRRDTAKKLPPGQYDTGSSWPVLAVEVTPAVDLDAWSMTVDGAVESPVTWSWSDIHELPGSEYAGDIHCVTTWSKFDTRFAGVSVDTLLAAARPTSEAAFVLAHSSTGYSTNMPLADVMNGQAWVVWEFDGKPLAPQHGGPARLLVPHLYFWKSAKWVNRLELLDEDKRGFWEERGYHDRGDPWQEQRYHSF